MDRFVRKERKRITKDFDVQSSCKELWLDPTPTPPEWAPLIGDILYNCRSALDHLANQLAGGRKNDRDTLWPIFTNPTEFLCKSGPMIKGMSPDARTFIEDSQPYKRTPNRPTYDWFALLNAMSNADKHRHLHTSAVIAWGVSWMGEMDIVNVHAGYIEHRTKLLTVRVSGPEVDVNPNLSLHVAFAEYRRWNMPVQTQEFFAETMVAIETLFGECLSRGLLPA